MLTDDFFRDANPSLQIRNNYIALSAELSEKWISFPEKGHTFYWLSFLNSGDLVSFESLTFMNTLKLFLFVAVITICSGCASTQTEKLNTKLNSIHRDMDGNTVLSKLGEPTTKVPSGGPLEVWIYNDEAFSEKRNKLIPVEYILYIEDGHVSSFDYAEVDL